jgi:cob(I)alamin adenosyltransferase
MSVPPAFSGMVQVYTGDGKGKTTAAMGLALRAAGAGLRVFVAQFMKSGESSEIAALAVLKPLIALETFGSGRFVRGIPSPEDFASAARGLARVRHVVSLGEHALVILDEANVALSVGILEEDALLDLIAQKPRHVELVFTGRGAPSRLLERADLVTEMRAIKHYFKKGVAARRGIES